MTKNFHFEALIILENSDGTTKITKDTNIQMVIQAAHLAGESIIRRSLSGSV